MRQWVAIVSIALALLVGDVAYSMMNPRLDFPTQGTALGEFPDQWIHGSKSALDNTDPPVQVHRFNDHTYILRENKAINYEGAFMYLLFGNNVAMLIDQGSTSSAALFPLREVVDAVIDQWQQEFDQTVDQLIVANSHLHGDHYAAWNQFVNRPQTLMVGLTHEEMMAFWGFSTYPNERVEYNLGGRQFVVTGTPGHQGSEIALYDKWTGLLYTGDMFYRGRLYLEDWQLWSDSINRLYAITQEYPITHLVNNHIEMTAQATVDYPIGTTWQPNEPPMQMTVSMLEQAVKATQEINQPGIYKFDDFLIYNEVPWAYTTDP